MLFDELFNDFFEDFNMFTPTPQFKEEKKCPVCGRSYSDFRRLGKFGCGECYKTFKTPIISVMKQLHTNSEHTGKIPSKSGHKIKQKRIYEDLKQKLQKAVADEDYETAAKLHKEIRKMENEVKQS